MISADNRTMAESAGEQHEPVFIGTLDESTLTERAVFDAEGGLTLTATLTGPLEATAPAEAGRRA